MFDFVTAVEAGEVESVVEMGEGEYMLHFKNHEVVVRVESVRPRY